MSPWHDAMRTVLALVVVSIIATGCRSGIEPRLAYSDKRALLDIVPVAELRGAPLPGKPVTWGSAIPLSEHELSSCKHVLLDASFGLAVGWVNGELTSYRVLEMGVGDRALDDWARIEVDAKLPPVPPEMRIDPTRSLLPGDGTFTPVLRRLRNTKDWPSYCTPLGDGDHALRNGLPGNDFPYLSSSTTSFWRGS